MFENMARKPLVFFVLFWGGVPLLSHVVFPKFGTRTGWDESGSGTTPIAVRSSSHLRNPKVPATGVGLTASEACGNTKGETRRSTSRDSRTVRWRSEEAQKLGWNSWQSWQYTVSKYPSPAIHVWKWSLPLKMDEEPWPMDFRGFFSHGFSPDFPEKAMVFRKESQPLDVSEAVGGTGEGLQSEDFGPGETDQGAGGRGEKAEGAMAEKWPFRGNPWIFPWIFHGKIRCEEWGGLICLWKNMFL